MNEEYLRGPGNVVPGSRMSQQDATVYNNRIARQQRRVNRIVKARSTVNPVTNGPRHQALTSELERAQAKLARLERELREGLDAHLTAQGWT